jgi:sulfopyruvate decarboxylase subunit beta
MMRRDEALKVLARHHRDEIVVAVYQAAFEWMVIKDWPLTYLAVGAMGQASSHALGLALGRPDKRVVVFDGDGSLLMNLGSLVTIAEARPANLVHLVFENGTYEANGAHPIPGAGGVSFTGLARAAGYAGSEDIATLDALARAAPTLLQKPGPHLAALKVEPGEPYPQRYDYIHSAAARERFYRALRES